MDGLQPNSYNVTERVIFWFRLYVNGQDVRGYKFTSWQLDQFRPEHAAGAVDVADIAVTRLTEDDIPNRRDDATLVVIDTLPAISGLPRFVVKLVLDGYPYFEGTIQVPAGTPAFRLDGTWTSAY